MARFEIEIPDNVASLMRKNSIYDEHRADMTAPGSRVVDIVGRFDQEQYAGRNPNLSDEDLAEVAIFFQRLGRWIQEFSGNSDQLISVEDRAKRAERSKRAHETRRRNLEAGLPTPKQLRMAAREREEAEQRRREIEDPPPLPANVVVLSAFARSRAAPEDQSA